MKLLVILYILLLVGCNRKSLVNSGCIRNCYQILKDSANSKLRESGEIKGRLFDFADNSPVTNARIIIKGTNFEQELKPNKYGKFSIELNEGSYIINISRIGIHELTTQQIKVRKGHLMKIDFMITYEI
ncbi:carboxypeptidase-like regulatory domain-containing protein [Emticicia sp. C21]|uniref:carboxypeptidase-like regulatory domain-containing protein n=1 Tax=Emticicia sp. C21 TaxID=2302915 RepID=UPI000E34B654|nr:carboxypeptidase-like regulatory domain-containing protein [Emticicia sp. C21]RFS16836.1 carboxypeptidase regulatory-like domain-containing protein [Emticicia sp. C21]